MQARQAWTVGKPSANSLHGRFACTRSHRSAQTALASSGHMKEGGKVRGRLDSMSSSNTRQSTATAMFRRGRDSSDHGLIHKGLITRRASYPQDRLNRLNGIGFDWTPPMGSRKRKAPPSTRKQTSRKVRVSSPSTKVNSPSAGDGARCAEPNGFKGEGRGATSALKVPSRRSDRNRGTESDDEVDEIGALIYDQVMRRR